MPSTLPDADARVRVGLFFAIFPPPSVAARIAELGRQLQSVHRLRGALTAPDRLHVTLYPIDLRKRALRAAVTRARDAALRIKAEPFDVLFNHTQSFEGGYPFVLMGDRGLVRLADLRRALGAALYHVELRDGASSFTPHVTLLYGGDRLIGPHPVSPIRWRVEDFRLILSEHGVGHRIMGQWPLGT